MQCVSYPSRPERIRQAPVVTWLKPSASGRGVALGYAREFRETRKASAFWRVAPTVRLSAAAILGAGVFFFAIDFSSRTSSLVHSRRFAFLAILTLSVWVQEHSI